MTTPHLPHVWTSDNSSVFELLPSIEHYHTTAYYCCSNECAKVEYISLAESQARERKLESRIAKLREALKHYHGDEYSDIELDCFDLVLKINSTDPNAYVSEMDSIKLTKVAREALLLDDAAESGGAG